MSESDSIMSRRNFVKMGAATIAGLAIAPNNLNGAGTEVYNEGANDLYPNNVPNSSHKLVFDGFRDNNHNLVDYPNKLYNPSEYSGFGRVILEKNMVNGVNTLTQTMVNAAYTIYIILYDYILDDDITIPANCTLQFEGGSIKNTRGNNYKVTGTKTHINTDVAYNIFNDTLGGGFELPFIDLRWVGGVSDWDGTIGTDNHDAFKLAIDTIGKFYDGMYVYIVGQYYIGTSVSTIYNVNIWGEHNNSRHLLSDTEMASISSPSMIVVGENIGFYMTGRAASGSTQAYAYFTLKNIKVYGTSMSSSKFIYYVASGSPSRVCVVDECEFTHLKHVFEFVATKDTVVGDLTISKCNVYENSKFIYAVSDADTTYRTLCNCIIKDSEIEWNGANCIYMDRAFSSIIIDNNILEGQPSPIYIKQTAGDVTISNNYFEANAGDAITVGSYNSNLCRLHFHNNFYDISISINVSNVALYGSLKGLSDDTRISNCYVEDIDNYKLSWLEGGNYGRYVVFDKFKTGINYRTPSSMTYTMRQGSIIGKECPTTLQAVGLTKLVTDADENLVVAFYASGQGTLGFYTNSSGYQSPYTTYNLRNGGLVIYKGLPYSTGEAVFMIKNNESGNILSLLGFYDEDTSPSYILVPDVNTPVRSAQRPSFPDMYVGYSFFDRSITPNRMIYYNGQSGSRWVDGTGKSV